MKGSFGSDNSSGVCQEAMRALEKANHGHVPSYGGDSYTKEAIELFKKEFDKKIEVFFVFNGTGANVAGLRALTRPYQSIICAQTSHIYTQETGAAFAQTGCKILPVPSTNGKITPDGIEEVLRQERFWRHHATMPKVVSVSQSTEFGTIYTLKELQDISKFCNKNDLLLHVDGCRIFNAAAALDCPLKALGREAGVDVMSVGGTKNGLMYAEAVVFFNTTYAKDFSYIQKQSLQLASKMRFISAQYIPFFKDKIWKKNASHANEMAHILASCLETIPSIEFAQKVETNQLFLRMPKKAIAALKKDFLFYVWNEPMNEIRMITSFDTTLKEVKSFIEHAKKAVK